MSTRSDIIVQRADGSWKRVYCHFDGYLEGVGATLFANYNSQASADLVVEPGDISSLGEHCDKPAGHTFDNRKPGYTTYYGRDRGEKGVAGRTGESLAAVWPPEDTWTEFTYVWSRDFGEPAGAWYVGDPDEGSQTIVRLDTALNDPANAPKTAIKAPWGVIGHR